MWVHTPAPSPQLSPQTGPPLPTRRSPQASCPQIAVGELPTTAGKSGDDHRRCGVFAGVFDQVSLLRRYPAFACVVVMGTFFTSCSALSILYLPGFQRSMWNTQEDQMRASRIAEVCNALRSLMTIVAAPYLGRLADRRGLLFGMALACVTLLLPPAALLCFGASATGLWVNTVLSILSGAVGASISGCPLIYAFVARTLPKEHVENGIGLLCVFNAFGGIVNNQGGNMVQAWVHEFRALVGFQLAVGLVSCALLAVLRASAGSKPIELDNIESKSVKMEGLLAPLKLAWRKGGLFYVSVVAALFSFSEQAMYGGFVYQYVFDSLNVTTADETTWTMLLFCVYPNGIMAVLYSLIGVLSRRFSPAGILLGLIPITALLFSAPVLLQVERGEIWVFVTGACLQTPLLCFVPLQAMVCHIVPPHRLAEAMCSVAAVKAVASVLAPAVTVALLHGFKALDLADASWTLFPAMSVVMLFALVSACKLKAKLDAKEAGLLLISASWGSWATSNAELGLPPDASGSLWSISPRMLSRSPMVSPRLRLSSRSPMSPVTPASRTPQFFPSPPLEILLDEEDAESFVMVEHDVSGLDLRAVP